MLAFVCCLTTCTLQYSACQLWYHVNLLRLLQARDLVEIIACTLPQMLEVRNAMRGCLQVVGYKNICMLGKHFVTDMPSALSMHMCIHSVLQWQTHKPRGE